MARLTPFLWFDDKAEEAATLYTTVFERSRILGIVRYGEAGPGSTGSVMTVRFELDGQELMALNGGPQRFSFNESVSFVVNCRSQEEVDHFWARLSEGGEEGKCGWLKDRYGLSWQVVPEQIGEILSDPDPVRANRATTAMLGMGKLDIDALRRAADGG